MIGKAYIRWDEKHWRYPTITTTTTIYGKTHEQAHKYRYGYTEKAKKPKEVLGFHRPNRFVNDYTKGNMHVQVPRERA